MLSIVIISILLAGTGVFSGTVQAGIQEEYLPQTHTCREITATLDTIENNLKSSDPTATLQQLDDLQTTCLSLKADSRENPVSELNSICDRINFLEMILNYYKGNLSAAAEKADLVFKSNPSMTLSGKVATAELAGWFEELRATKIGFASFSSQPSGSKVYLSGDYYGVTPLENVYAPLGEHEVRITHTGFTTWVGQVLIAKTRTEIIRAELRQNTGNLLVWVSPAGTRITIDSNMYIERTKPLDLTLYPLALAFGLDPSNISQPLLINAVKPGKKSINFSNDCYLPVDFNLNITIGNFVLPTVFLAHAESLISINSKPSGKIVFIDNKRAGKTPLRNYVICPGRHKLSVEFENNQTWSQFIKLDHGDNAKYEASPRPSILFLGCAASNTGLAIEGTYPIKQWFEKSNAWNLVDPGKYKYRPAVAAVMEAMSDEAFSANDPNWIDLLNNMSAALLDSNTSLIAFAHLVPNKSRRNSQLFILHSASRKPDIVKFSAGIPESNPPQQLKTFLNRPLTLKRLQSGLRVITFENKLVITEIIPGGPAENSPFQTGDVILSIGDIHLTCQRDFEKMLKNPDSKELQIIKVLRETREITAEIKMFWQPCSLPLNDPEIPYNLIYSRIESLVRKNGMAPELFVNAGICSLAINRPTLAISFFDQCDLSSRQGFNNGTLSYLKYLAKNNLERSSTAQKEFEIAVKFPGSTIIHGDGPLLIDMIR